MKIIAYLTSGARAKPLHKRWTVPVPRPEGEILGERDCGNILTTIVRWRHGDGWEWRAVETNGTALWFYELVPDSNGNVLKPRAIDAFQVLPGYEAMVEGVTPLAPDDPDRLIVPDAERAADLAHWRAKYVAASAAAASLGAIKSERKAAASRANGAKGGRPCTEFHEGKVFASEGGFRVCGGVWAGGPIIKQSPWYATREEAEREAAAMLKRRAERDELDRLAGLRPEGL